MIPHQMLLIPRIPLHPFIILHAPKHSLAETVEISHFGHLRVEKLGHEGAGGGCVVYLLFT